MIKVKTKIIGVRCTESAFLKVEEIANELEISNGEVLRRCLNYYMDSLREKKRKEKEKGEE